MYGSENDFDGYAYLIVYYIGLYSKNNKFLKQKPTQLMS
jgi:hypothetical protein